MSNLPLIIGGVALGFFLLNQKKSKIIYIGENKKQIPPDNKNKSDEIIKISFPGYEIKNDKVIISNEKETFQYAYKQGSQKNKSLDMLNIMIEKLLGLKTYSVITRPYNTKIVEKIINIYKSNSDFIYTLWLYYSAGFIDNGSSYYPGGSGYPIIMQFLDLLYGRNIEVLNPIQLDLDRISKKDIVLFDQPYYTGVNQEVLDYVLFPGYFIKDELLSIISDRVKLATNYAFIVGKNEAESNYFKYLFGGPYVEYTDAYKNHISKYGNVSLIVKNEKNSSDIYLLLSFLLAGAYLNNKQKSGKYANILNKYTTFVNNNFKTNYPVLKSIEEANQYFENVINKV